MGLGIFALNFKSPLSTKREDESKPPCFWVELPESSFGIQYEMSSPIATRVPSTRSEASAKSAFSFSKECINKYTKKRNKIRSRHPPKTNPFEVMLTTLNHVTSRYPSGTAILYIREILEPGDPEFGCFANRRVRTSRLSQSQVQRLRLLILPQRREEILIAYLEYYKSLHCSNELIPLNISSQVTQHFSGFKRRYSTSTSVEERFDLLFGYSFAIHKYSAWMHQYERKRSRETLLSALARHWRHLLMKHSATELGLDEEFSYPALYSFLESFKQQIENVDMKDLPDLKFNFEAPNSPRRFQDERRVSFDNDSISVSTTTTCTMSEF
eukprot:scaffold2200_cov112-Cylindrotheca_fusiformis.AAC.6